MPKFGDFSDEFNWKLLLERKFYNGNSIQNPISGKFVCNIPNRNHTIVFENFRFLKSEIFGIRDTPNFEIVGLDGSENLKDGGDQNLHYIYIRKILYEVKYFP